MCKACGLESGLRYHYDMKRSPFLGRICIHSGSFLKYNDTIVEPLQDSGKPSTPNDTGNAKIARKKLKGKRAVVRWLKFFRWKKKKEYERMTAEEKLLYKLKKVNSTSPPHNLWSRCICEEEEVSLDTPRQFQLYFV